MVAVPATEIAGVRRITWESHVRWLRGHLEPGQHISGLVPTGGGKSYLVVNGLLKLPVIDHSRVLFVDDKGRDRTTRTFGSGIVEYPLGLGARLRLSDQPPHYRLVVPDWTWSSTGSHSRGVEHARAVVGRALDAIYQEAEDPTDEGASEEARPSVVVIDETYALTASRPPSLNLAPLLINLWRKGRYKALTVIALSQEPAWLPGEFYSQPTHLYVGKILDSRRQDRLKEIGGDTAAIREVVSQLDEYEFLFLGNKGKVMSIVKVGR